MREYYTGAYTGAQIDAGIAAANAAAPQATTYTKSEVDTALAAKADLVSGKVPASELPSYVDDSIEGYYYNGAFYEDSEHTTIITGERGKIYIDLTANKSYRWTGTVYTRIDECPAFGETTGTIYEGNKGKANADAIGTLSSLTTTVKTDLVSAINELDSDKVDAVSGKGLSTEDYTTAEKTKLSSIATGAEVNVQANWTQTDTGADDYIKNKPTIPAAQVNADWDAVSGVSQILNKPTIPAAQVSSDWNASSGVAQILNKPTLGTAAAANTTTSITSGGTGLPTSGTVYGITGNKNSLTTTAKTTLVAAINELNTNKIAASSYATQNTGGTVKVWTTTDGTDTILHIATQ